MATRVVLVTVNGAVPPATLEINRVPVIVLFAPTAPSTCNVEPSHDMVVPVEPPAAIPINSILDPLLEAVIVSVAVIWILPVPVNAEPVYALGAKVNNTSPDCICVGTASVPRDDNVVILLSVVEAPTIPGN